MKDHHFSEQIAAKLGIDNKEITRRKAFLDFTEEDAELLRQIHDLLAASFQSDFVEAFYEHILAFEETRELIAQSGVNQDDLKSTQLAYFQSLTSGNYDLPYFLNRLKVGLAHERIGLDVKWYIGAYRKYLSELFHYLEKNLRHDTEQLTRVFDAIIKVVSLDIALAIDAYIYSNHQTISNLEQRQNNLIQGIDGFIWEFDVEKYKYRYVSSKAESLLGYPQKQWFDNPDFQQQIVFSEFRQETQNAFKKAINEGRDFAIEYKVHALDGEPVWISERVTAEKDSTGKVILLRGLMLDIGERKHRENQLSYLATYDELTGLPNRNLFNSHLKIALADAQRNNKKLAIMFLDLDNFKDVNDSLGHDAGDQLLHIVGKRLEKQILRGADLVARFGGDEFCIILENSEEDFRPERVAERCLQELGKPTQIGTSDIYPRGSIGIALFPDDGITSEVLLQCADNAMYAAKGSGKSRYVFYNAEMTQLAEKKLRLENDLRIALEKGNFELHYQPQVSLATGEVVGVEALIRWFHPEHGMVPPDEFIPVAEKIGLIADIGEWVLRTASRQFVEWRNASVPLYSISVNISGTHFRTGKLPQTIANVIHETGINPENLEIEITEGVLQTGTECIQCFKKIKEFGVQIAIDDFGTGYSCLNSLTQLPIDRLKIDKTFIQEVLSDTNDSAIVATILSMSRIMNFSVIAEGVETIDQLNYLQGVGCDIVQGYFFSKPVIAEKVPELVSTGFLPIST